MSHHTASLQFTLGKTATAFDLARTAANRLYWLDDTYVQPFYTWAAPRLQKVAISGLYWTLIALIEIALWLIETTSQFMARDAHAIALSAFAHAHEPLPNFPALCPAAVPLALPSMLLPMAPDPVMPMASTAEDLDDVAPVIMLYPSVVPEALSTFIQPDDSVRRWLTAALPLVLAPWIIEALAVPVSSVVLPIAAEDIEAAPVVPEVLSTQTSTASAPVPKTRKTNKSTDKQITDKAKAPRKRSPRTTAAQ